MGRLFEQQPVERMEIQAALTELSYLLDPPEDDMHPTRAEFCESVYTCRDAVAKLLAKAEAADGAKPSAEIEKARRWRDSIDRIEAYGLKAHTQCDRRVWARAHDEILGIRAQVQEMPSLEGVPTSLLKGAACQYVQKTVDHLRNQATGLSGDWGGEVRQLEQRLGQLIGKIQRVDDGLPSDRGLAEIRIALRDLRPIEEKIRGLGIDLTSAAPFG